MVAVFKKQFWNVSLILDIGYLIDMNSKDGLIGAAILFIIMMVAVFWILVHNALHRLSTVIQEIPTEYSRLFAESEIAHIRHGMWLLLIFGLIGWGSYLWYRRKR